MKRQSEATKTRKQEHAEARKQVMQQTAVPAATTQNKKPSKARKAWEDKVLTKKQSRFSQSTRLGNRSVD